MKNIFFFVTHFAGAVGDLLNVQEHVTDSFFLGFHLFLFIIRIHSRHVESFVDDIEVMSVVELNLIGCVLRVDVDPKIDPPQKSGRNIVSVGSPPQGAGLVTKIRRRPKCSRIFNF